MTIIIKDNEGNSIESKIDLGVHANMKIEQDTYCFDVCMDDEGASLLINSCEQIFAEKLRSLLRFGPLSTRVQKRLMLQWLRLWHWTGRSVTKVVRAVCMMTEGYWSFNN